MTENAVAMVSPDLKAIAEIGALSVVFHLGVLYSIAKRTGNESQAQAYLRTAKTVAEQRKGQ